MTEPQKKNSKQEVPGGNSGPLDFSVLLGDWKCSFYSFSQIETVLEEFKDPGFGLLSNRERLGRVNQVLLDLIQLAPHQTFLLPTITAFIDKINTLKILNEPFKLVSFEFWLNHFSHLSEQEQYLIRGKIAGKFVPRDDYQVYFPIGMGKVFEGTHFVTAHMSPDVDTMIASFWGWVDAFAAKVGTGQHIWALPGGPPDSPTTDIFYELFGRSSFSSLARTSTTLSLSAMDLVNKKNFLKESASTSINSFDRGRHEKAVILVDQQECYLGDWRSSDVELVRQIVILFKACLHWFQNHLQNRLISLFAQKTVNREDISKFLSVVFESKIQESEPVLDFSPKQKELLNDFLFKVLHLPKGLDSTYSEVNQTFKTLSIPDFSSFLASVESLRTSGLFNEDGKLHEDRPLIFHLLEQIFFYLNNAIYHLRNYAERLDVVMQIKKEVLGSPLHYLTMQNDVEEIRIKMNQYDYLTVAIPEENRTLFPVGVVWANDLRKPVLGTVSFRDFCNSEEVKMASYLSVISVVDHHKSSLQTGSTPMAMIGDVQSCNVLLAEQSLLLNSRYGTGGMSPEQIESQIQELSSSAQTPSQIRLLQNLLQRRLASQIPGRYFSNPEREYAEYMLFLHAICDDTDLLTKVSNRDVECVASLLNRLKTLQKKRETEIICLDDIPRNNLFAKTAAKRILQHPDMFSIYLKSYAMREQEVENNLKLCLENKNCNIFMDTKEQNGCCRIGQTKMFASNFSTFSKNVDKLRTFWLKNAEEVYRDRPEVDLHLQMISTIATAQEVYTGKMGVYDHRDELWFWTPQTQQAYDHLTIFLTAFGTSLSKLEIKNIELEFLSKEMTEIDKIFSHNFIDIPRKWRDSKEQQIPIAILRIDAGSLNSRKSMISPYLPKLVS